jgi:hypothetical protein
MNQEVSSVIVVIIIIPPWFSMLTYHLWDEQHNMTITITITITIIIR